MQTVNEKLLTELKSSPKKRITGEVYTLIDDDLRAALFDLLSQSDAVEQTDEEAANYYAECCNGGSRGSGIIQQSFVAGCHHVRQQLSKEQQQRTYSEEDMHEAFYAGMDFLHSSDKPGFEEWLTKYNNTPKQSTQ